MRSAFYSDRNEVFAFNLTVRDLNCRIRDNAVADDSDQRIG